MLELINLCCERGERTLFAGLGCRLDAGQGLRIAGANGSGKTTLLRTIAGLSHRYTGDILWCGESLLNNRDALRSELLYFGHSPGVKPTLSPLENLDWWVRLYSLGNVGAASEEVKNRDSLVDEEQLYAALAWIGLAGYEFTPCHQLSAGQQRRVALARLFLSRHRLWILDEPFTAIDVKGVAALQQRFGEHMSDGGMVVLTTHQSMDGAGFSTINVDEFLP